jgi:predicted NAD/FAD-dependent oxidoreductase
VDAWLAEGDGSSDGDALAVWSHGFPRWRGGNILPAEVGHPRYAPTRGMSALPKRFALGLDVRAGMKVTSVERHGDGLWGVAATAAGEERAATLSARAVVLSLPPAQLLPLAGDALPEATRQRLATVAYDPCWALIARPDADVNAEWRALDLSGEGGHPVLSFLSRDHTKRPDAATAPPPVLVAHASVAWSRGHLEDAPEAVTAALLAAVREVVGADVSFREALVHRWRYALARELYPEPSFWHPDLGLGGCGDWCAAAGGGKIEGALESGWHLARGVFRANEEGEA